MEYRAEAATAGTSYYTRITLGSTRLETNAAGQQRKYSDFLPFEKRSRQEPAAALPASMPTTTR
jgi:hypothetical protein